MAGVSHGPVQNAKWNFNSIGGSYITQGQPQAAAAPARQAPQQFQQQWMPPPPPMAPPVKPEPEEQKPAPALQALQAAADEGNNTVGDGQAVYTRPLAPRTPASLDMLLQGLRY